MSSNQKEVASCCTSSNLKIGVKYTGKVEVVVRAYLTGTTGTSVWSHYSNGSRNYCSHALPEGLKKNVALPGGPWVTPTTKEEAHDRPISGEEVVSLGLMSSEEWITVRDRALAVFNFGVAEARKRDLILVDTKYEFGLDERTGEILLIDEVHTPDSSRYWKAGSYESRISMGKEPENIDKEFLRLWFRDNCDPYQDAVLPAAPASLVAELSSRYVTLYEAITGLSFDMSLSPPPTIDRASIGDLGDSAVFGGVEGENTVVAVIRTAGEEDGAEEARDVASSLSSAASVPGRGGGNSAPSRALAVEVHAVNAAEGPVATWELARGLSARGVAAAIVLGGVAGVTTSSVIAHHGNIPVVCVSEGGAGDALPRDCPVLIASSTNGAVAFLKAMLSHRMPRLATSV